MTRRDGGGCSSVASAAGVRRLILQTAESVRRPGRLSKGCVCLPETSRPPVQWHRFRPVRHTWARDALLVRRPIRPDLPLLDTPGGPDGSVVWADAPLADETTPRPRVLVPLQSM